MVVCINVDLSKRAEHELPGGDNSGPCEGRFRGFLWLFNAALFFMAIFVGVQSWLYVPAGSAVWNKNWYRMLKITSCQPWYPWEVLSSDRWVFLKSELTHQLIRSKANANPLEIAFSALLWILASGKWCWSIPLSMHVITIIHDFALSSLSPPRLRP